MSLDGTNSFDDTTRTVQLEFAWSFSLKPTGSAATLGGANTATPSFVADAPGEFRAQLVVTDEAGNASASEEVIVSSLNVAPTAEAGDGQVVVLNTQASLDGIGSMDPDGDPLGFCWTITSAPIGSISVLLGATTATPSLTPDLAGTYVIQLVVNDGFADSTPDTTIITAITGAAFAETKLKDACDLVTGLPNSSFDAPGHRNYFCNMSSKIIKSLQMSNVDQAKTHLEELISRVDGFALRGAPDPKGKGQPHAADFITDGAAQQQLYQLLTDALNAL